MIGVEEIGVELTRAEENKKELKRNS